MTSIYLKPMPKQARGAAVTISMLALLLVSSMIVFTSSKSVIANSKVVRNQFYEDSAFEAAEAGLEYGLVHLKENLSTITVDDDENSGAGNGYIDSYTDSATTSANNGNGTTYSVTYSNPVVNNFDVIQISVAGSSDSGNVTKNITQLSVRIPYMQVSPPAGFITKGSVSLGGNVNITNTSTGNTIWSGGAVTLGGSASTTGDGVGSDRNNLNSDINQNDTQLSSLTDDDFFKTNIGTDKATAKANADVLLTYTSNQNISSVLDPDSNNGKAIWVDQQAGEASFSGNATIGSQDKPVVLIIDGDFKANGTTEIWGVVYVTQDWHNSGGGNLTIHGAVIVEGDFSGTGTPNVIFDQQTLNNVRNIAEFAKVPGSWRDF